MKHYIEAQKELYGRIVDEFDYGFICYSPKTSDNGLYIQLAYIQKDKRSSGLARKMLIETLEKNSAAYATGYIDLTAHNYKEILIKHLNGGYDVMCGTQNSLTVYVTLDILKKQVINE